MQIIARAQAGQRWGGFGGIQAGDDVVLGGGSQVGGQNGGQQAVRFVGIALAQIADVGGVVGICLRQGGSQFGSDGHEAVGHAEGAVEFCGAFAVAFHRQPAMEAQGLGGDGGGDEWVAVAVAAHPGGEGEEAGGWGEGGVMLRQGFVHSLVDVGQDVPDGAVQVVEARFYFVGDVGAGDATAAGGPQAGDFGRDLGYQSGAFGWDEVA